MDKYLRHTRLVDGCMVWTRCLNTDGYPRANINGSSNGKVHREVFFLANGYYPEVVRHTCDNPRCINPEHLLGGSMTENMKDRSDRGRTSGHVSKEEFETMLKMRASGLTYAQIADNLNVKAKRVEYIIQRLARRIRKFVA